MATSGTGDGQTTPTNGNAFRLARNRSVLVNVIASVGSQIRWVAVGRATPNHNTVAEVTAAPISDPTLERTINPFSSSVTVVN